MQHCGQTGFFYYGTLDDTWLGEVKVDFFFQTFHSREINVDRFVENVARICLQM